MKGLEKDIVFLMGMCEGVFPDYRANTKKELEEELNSAFVAITRAKRWIFVSYPLQRVMPWGSSKSQSVSRFIKMLQV
jgi:DNA helicase-2/ATP-dependent DNA helicase PcrA